MSSISSSVEVVVGAGQTRPQVGGVDDDPGGAVGLDAAGVNVARSVGEAGEGEAVGGGVAEQATANKATTATTTNLTTMSIAKSRVRRKGQTGREGKV